MPLDPYVVRPVNHDLGHFRVFQHGFQAGQKGFEQLQAVVAHNFPSAFARQ